VPKLVWRVKLVAEFGAGETTEVEVARLERDEHASVADLGLRLAEAKQITAALQAEIVPAQVTVASEHRRTCVACEGALASKGHYTATFRSLFGDVSSIPSFLFHDSNGLKNAGERPKFAFSRHDESTAPRGGVRPPVTINDQSQRKGTAFQAQVLSRPK
jgi:hypothetical protein